MIPIKGRKRYDIRKAQALINGKSVKLNDPFMGPVLMSKTHISTKIQPVYSF